MSSTITRVIQAITSVVALGGLVTLVYAIDDRYVNSSELESLEESFEQSQRIQQLDNLRLRMDVIDIQLQRYYDLEERNVQLTPRQEWDKKSLEDTWSKFKNTLESND